MSKKAREILKKSYSRCLIPEADGGYSAYILEFPGCFADGNSATEALENLERAAVSWIEACFHTGYQIMDPIESPSLWISKNYLKEN